MNIMASLFSVTIYQSVQKITAYFYSAVFHLINDEIFCDRTMSYQEEIVQLLWLNHRRKKITHSYLAYYIVTQVGFIQPVFLFFQKPQGYFCTVVSRNLLNSEYLYVTFTKLKKIQMPTYKDYLENAMKPSFRQSHFLYCRDYWRVSRTGFFIKRYFAKSPPFVTSK